MLVWLIVCFYVAPVHAVIRKYDIESESLKLYGDDLKSVLTRFRRTPDYLEFLKFYVEEMKQERDETAHYLLNVYHRKLMDDIDEMFGVNTTRRLWPNLERSFKLRKKFLRANERNTSDSKEAIRKLDNYHLLHSVLTVEERNNFRNLGFQMAGELIHALMKSLKPEDKGYESTRQPWDEGNKGAATYTTTKHSHMVYNAFATLRMLRESKRDGIAYHQVTTDSTVVTIYANALNSTRTKKPLRHGRTRKIQIPR